jgi:hypothetical protein
MSDVGTGLFEHFQFLIVEMDAMGIPHILSMRLHSASAPQGASVHGLAEIRLIVGFAEWYADAHRTFSQALRYPSSIPWLR